MENHWQEVWERHGCDFEGIDMNDRECVILELKRAVGWKFYDNKNTTKFSEFVKEYEYLRRNLRLPEHGSVFEVGCGSGANLYFFHSDGYEVGGSDYAANMIEITEHVLGRENMLESIVGEASELPVDRKYDAVLSAGVFMFFNDFEYAERVLDLMLEKTKHSLGLTRILDAAKEDEFLAFRRAHVKNYDELYKGLPKLFYPKEFFIDYAARHSLEIKFDQQHMEGFWNEPFNFDCFMYK